MSQYFNAFPARSNCKGYRLCAGLFFLLATVPSAMAAETGPAEENPENLKLSTAVALNYCRASFHRIRQNSSKPVLLQEREKILNNLNLTLVADQEVVRLYTAVLDEIAEVQIAEAERKLIRIRHQRAFVERTAISGLALATQLGTMEYGAAIRTGVRSWWDYRSMYWQCEIDSWQIEKGRVRALVDKSAQFLDTFWKLARKRNIPDHWLIRTNNLDELDRAMREPDPKVRLRVLKRMEHFMTCYPPYWYYRARTEQSLGQLFAAGQTYAKLQELEDGHFRTDEMLAAGLANRAAIQEYLGQPSAAKTARDALKYSIDVWEVNLVCARVLEKHGHFEEAEDAILRNLDVNLERRQSLIHLVWVYYRSANKQKLSDQLADVDVVSKVPAPVLLQCAQLLGRGNLPKAALVYLRSSLDGDFDLHFGRDDFVLRGLAHWHLEDAKISLIVGGKTFGNPKRQLAKGTFEARFPKVMEMGVPLASHAKVPQATVLLAYPHTPEIRLELRQTSEQPATRSTTETSSLLDATKHAKSLFTLRDDKYRIVAIHIGETQVMPQTPATGNKPSAPTKAVSLATP